MPRRARTASSSRDGAEPLRPGRAERGAARRRRGSRPTRASSRPGVGRREPLGRRGRRRFGGVAHLGDRRAPRVQVQRDQERRARRGRPRRCRRRTSVVGRDERAQQAAPRHQHVHLVDAGQLGGQLLDGGPHEQRVRDAAPGRFGRRPRRRPAHRVRRRRPARRPARPDARGRRRARACRRRCRGRATSSPYGARCSAKRRRPARRVPCRPPAARAPP